MTAPDQRFSLANERTYLAWIRTAFALIAGGVAAAKALDFHHEVLRWIVAIPPLVGGGVLAVEARNRYRAYQAAMAAGRDLPVRRGSLIVSVALGVYVVVVLVVLALD